MKKEERGVKVIKEIGARLYSLEDVAKMCEVAPRTVRHWIKTGKLKGIKFKGKSWISEKELKRFFDVEEVKK